MSNKGQELGAGVDLKPRNKCQCLYCKDIIESKDRYHFVKCVCGAIFTDGGLDYIRRGFGKPEYLSFVKDPRLLEIDNFYPIRSL